MATNSYMSYRVRTPNGKVEYFEEEKAELGFVQSDAKGNQRLLSEYIIEKCVLRAVAAKKHITTYWQRIPMSPTGIERDLRKGLLAKGYVENEDFVFQYPFGWYTLDFAFVEEKIDVECDGEYWHPQENPSDRNRDATMKKNGWITLRFTGKQIKTNLEDVITQIDTVVRRARQRHSK